ncbi:MAG: BrnT family toxin [Anaerolineales bacterium]|nr:BrnT family toxin [Anaerolineales bacterium]
MQEAFEWDEQKRLTNVHRHGIDFEDAIMIFAGDIVTVEDDRFDYGEVRFMTLGVLKGRVITVVHTERQDRTRIISARKATKYEQTIYFQFLSN